MAQTTWSDMEFRRNFLEGLAALTDGNRRQRHTGRALVAGFTVALGVAIAVALL